MYNFREVTYMFYERFVQLCAGNNEKPTTVLKKIGVSSGNLNNWKNGTSVKSDILMQLSEHFNVSVDYLLGRTEEQNSNQNQTLSQNEQELLDIFKNFSERDQIKILGKMEEWISTSRRENINSQKIVGVQVARRTDHKFVKKPVTAEELEKIKALPEDTDY